MKSKWKGALIGGIIGSLISFLFLINLGVSYCVKGFGLGNLICSVSQTFKEFGIIASILSIPKLLIINILRLNGMNEIIISPLIIILGFIIGFIISFLLNYSRKNEK